MAKWFKGEVTPLWYLVAAVKNDWISGKSLSIDYFLGNISEHSYIRMAPPMRLSTHSITLESVLWNDYGLRLVSIWFRILTFVD